MNNVNELLLKCIKSREELTEPKLRLRPLLKVMGMEGYIKLCSRRIVEADLIDGEDIDFNLCDPYDLIFTADGIILASDILKGYCDERKLKEMLGVLKQTRKLYDTVNYQALLLQTLDTSELKDMRNKKNSDNLSDDAMNQISKFAAAELRARRIYNVALRKISYIVYLLKTYMRYRWLRRFIRQVQDIDSAN